MSELRCGQKIGKKLSDPDSKWCEKWFEVKCLDNQNTKSEEPQHIIIKYYAKFWTDIESRMIEGDSCIQVLSDGKDDFMSHNLLLEMKYNCKFENILNKEGSLKTTTKKVKKLVPVATRQTREPEKLLPGDHPQKTNFSPPR